jgi:phosphocarrier protein HPr
MGHQHDGGEPDKSWIVTEVTIVNRLGIHARAAGSLRRTAARFKSDIIIKRLSMSANAKSLLGLMALEAAQGTSVTVMAHGHDAEQAVKTLVQLVQDRFGESE